jgi:hypothetical protein
MVETALDELPEPGWALETQAASFIEHARIELLCPLAGSHAPNQAEACMVGPGERGIEFFAEHFQHGDAKAVHVLGRTHLDLSLGVPRFDLQRLRGHVQKGPPPASQHSSSFHGQAQISQLGHDFRRLGCTATAEGVVLLNFN